MPTLGQIIKMYREENNMSMDDFSKKSGLSKSYISVLEKNKRPGSNKPIVPSNTVIEQVAKAINVPTENLWATVFFEDMVEAIDKINSDPTAYIDDDDKEIIEMFLPQNPKADLCAKLYNQMTDDNFDKWLEYGEWLLSRQNKEE